MLTHFNWTSLETRRQQLCNINSTSHKLREHCATLDPTVSRPSTLIWITTITRTFHEQYENGITYPQTLPRPHPCPHSEEGWHACKPTQPALIHTHALLHYYSHSCTLHTPHPVHNLQHIEVRAVSMMKMKVKAPPVNFMLLLVSWFCDFIKDLT